MLPTTPTTLGDVKLSYKFILTGLLSFISFLVLFLIKVDFLQMGIYRTSDFWVLAHLFILGFLIMVIMGVMYQLLPVALLVSVYSNKLAQLNYWTYLIGFLGLIYGLWVMDTTSMFIFGTFTFTGALIFIINMFLSIKAIKSWNMMSVIISTAIFYFFMTVLFGLTLVTIHNYHIWQNYLNDVLYSHILFGMVGWLTTLIMGFSYKLVPMFALSHGYSTKLAKWIFIILQAGIISVVTGLFADIGYLAYGGLLLVIAAYVLFVLQIKEVLKKKLKSKLDIGFTTAIRSIYLATGLLLFGPIGFIIWQQAFVLPYVYLFLTGWIALSIMGYLLKIVPFLWWTDKYSERVGKEQVPMLKDMIDEQKGKWAFILMLVAILGNTAGFALHLSIIMYISSAIFLIGGLLYSYLVIRVFSI